MRAGRLMPKCRPTLIPLDAGESYVHHHGGFNTRIVHAIFVIFSVITALLMSIGHIAVAILRQLLAGSGEAPASPIASEQPS
jgi:hypothetical protein